MSVSIATLGMFTPSVGTGTGEDRVSGGGIIYREDEEEKPRILVKSVYEEKSKITVPQHEFIIVKSIINGELKDVKSKY